MEVTRWARHGLISSHAYNGRYCLYELLVSDLPQICWSEDPGSLHRLSPHSRLTSKRGHSWEPSLTFSGAAGPAFQQLAISMEIAGVDEFRHAPAEAKSQQPQAKAERERQNDNKVVVQADPLTSYVEQADDDRDGRVEFGSK